MVLSFVKRVVQLYLTRNENVAVMNIGELCENQKRALERLKKKTRYDTVHALIEKYETAIQSVENRLIDIDIPTHHNHNHNHQNHIHHVENQNTNRVMVSSSSQKQRQRLTQSSPQFSNENDDEDDYAPSLAPITHHNKNDNSNNTNNEFEYPLVNRSLSLNAIVSKQERRRMNDDDDSDNDNEIQMDDDDRSRMENENESVEPLPLEFHDRNGDKDGKRTINGRHGDEGVKNTTKTIPRTRSRSFQSPSRSPSSSSKTDRRNNKRPIMRSDDSMSNDDADDNENNQKDKQQHSSNYLAREQLQQMKSDQARYKMQLEMIRDQLMRKEVELKQREMKLQSRIQQFQHMERLRNEVDAAVRAPVLTPNKLYGKFINNGNRERQLNKIGEKNNNSRKESTMDVVVDKQEMRAKNFSGGWLGRVVDRLMGHCPEDCLALICDQCHSHNGLMMLEDGDQLQRFNCWQCGYHNAKLLIQNQAAISTTSTPVVPPTPADSVQEPPVDLNRSKPAPSSTSSTNEEERKAVNSKSLEKELFGPTNEEVISPPLTESQAEISNDDDDNDHQNSDNDESSIEYDAMLNTDDVSDMSDEGKAAIGHEFDLR